MSNSNTSQAKPGSNQERDLFFEALEISDLSERAKWLEEACGGNEELRARINRLIAADEDDNDDFLDPEEQSLHEILRIVEETAGPNKRPKDLIIDFGGYQLHGEIARGAMGIVYRGHHQRLDRMVAIKMIRGAMLASEEDVLRFHTEAKATAQLDHPNIVPIYEIGEWEGQHFYSMKLIEGGTLVDHISSSKNCPKDSVHKITRVAKAVHAAHERGILHRDLKPGNILLDLEGNPFVTDFGLAKLLGNESGLTLSGQIMGTPFYMAPEQAKGEGKLLTTAADLYSLGAILFEMLAGHPPFRGESALDTLRQVASESPSFPSGSLPEIDRDLKTITLKCLEKDPASRYPSALEFARDLERWLAGEPIQARPAKLSERTFKWVRRNPIYAGFWSVTILLLILFGVGGPIIAIQQRNLKQDALESQSRETKARSLADRRAAENRIGLYLAEMNSARQALRESEGLKEIKRLTDRWIPTSSEEDLRGWEWYFLRSLTLQKSPSIQAHSGAILDLAYSHDGKFVATTSTDRRVSLWNSDLEFLTTLGPFNEQIESVSWSPDDQKLVLAGGRELHVYHPKSGIEPEALELEQIGRINSASWAPDGRQIAIAGSGGLSLLDFDTHELKHFDGSIAYDASWAPDGSKVTTSYITYDARTFEELWTLDKVDRRQLCVEWSPNGSRIAIGGANGRIRIVDSKTGQPRSSFVASVHMAEDLSWSHDSARLASAGDSAVKIWNPMEGKVSHLLRGHAGATFAVDWHPDGKFLVSGDDTGQMRKVNIESSGPGRILGDSRVHIVNIAWSPDGSRLAVVRYNDAVRIWDPKKQIVLQEISANRAGQQTQEAFAWSPDGSEFAVAGWDKKVRIWKSLEQTEQPHLTLSGLQSRVHQLSYTADESLLGFGYQDMACWNLKNEEIRYQKKYVSTYLTARGSLDSSKNYFVMREGSKIHICEASTGNLVRSLECPKSTALAWSSKGRFLAAGDRNGVIRIWNLADPESEEKPFLLEGQVGSVNELTWNFDDTRLASAGADGTCRIWSPKLERQLLVIDAHEGPCRIAHWNPDGMRLATVGNNGEVKVWDASTAYAEEN